MVKRNPSRTKGCACKQVFGCILLGASSRECLSCWIIGVQRPSWPTCSQSRRRTLSESSTIGLLVFSHLPCSAAFRCAVPGRAAACPALVVQLGQPSVTSKEGRLASNAHYWLLWWLMGGGAASFFFFISPIPFTVNALMVNKTQFAKVIWGRSGPNKCHEM